MYQISVQIFLHRCAYFIVFIYFNFIDPEGLKKPLDMEQVYT
jgi:hypothetical protein